VRVPFAIELSFDESADAAVRTVWDRLDQAGVTTLAAPFRPHASLAVIEDGDPDELWEELAEPVRSCLGIPLTLAALGFFLTDEAVAFLHVVPTAGLLDCHRRVIAACSAEPPRLWPYYGIDRLVPHCTLATGLRDGDGAKVVETLAQCRLPISAHIAMGALVEVPGGHTLRSVGRPGPR